MSQPSPSDQIESLVARVRNGVQPTAAETAPVLQILRVWLSRRRLDPRDSEEISAEALRRLLDAAQRDALDPSRPAGAWLRVVADRLVIDLFRRSPRAQPVAFDEQQHAGTSEDDRLAALLDRTALAADIRRAIREAGDSGEMQVVNVIATWLGLAAANGDAPSTREVGERLGVSHTTVRRALQAFGERLAGADVPRPPDGA